MDKVKLRDAQEIDVIIDCPCGASFYVYIPDVPIECPDCHKLYEVNLSVKETTKSNWSIQPHRIRTED